MITTIEITQSNSNYYIGHQVQFRTKDSEGDWIYPIVKN